MGTRGTCMHAYTFTLTITQVPSVRRVVAKVLARSLVVPTRAHDDWMRLWRAIQNSARSLRSSGVCRMALGWQPRVAHSALWMAYG